MYTDDLNLNFQAKPCFQTVSCNLERFKQSYVNLFNGTWDVYDYDEAFIVVHCLYLLVYLSKKDTFYSFLHHSKLL